MRMWPVGVYLAVVVLCVATMVAHETGTGVLQVLAAMGSALP